MKTAGTGARRLHIPRSGSSCGGSAFRRAGQRANNNAFGKSIHGPGKEHAAEIGVNIVSIEEFPPATVDLTTELMRFKRGGAEYVFMQMLPAAIITALRCGQALL